MKKILALKQLTVIGAVLAAGGIAPAWAQSCAPVPDGLVSWWRAENNTQDSWGTNHGSATAKFEPGKVGQCFTAASETRIPNSPSLQLTNALTIEAWVNPGASGVFILPRSIVSKFHFRQFGEADTGSYYLGLSDGKNPTVPVFMLAPFGSDKGAIRLVAPDSLPTNQWSHLAATYDGAVMRLYYNGVMRAQTNYTGIVFRGTNDVGIGATPLSGSTRSYYAFNGLIDEASIYRRALSAAEIEMIYNASSAGKCLPSCVASPTGLISWWPADGIATDAMGLNNLVEAPAYAAGMVGQAFNFVRSSGSVAFNSPSLNFGSNANFSVEMWIQATTTNASHWNVPLLEKRTISNLFSNSFTGIGYSFSLNQGRLAFWLSPNIATSNAAPFISSGPDLRDGQFHHVAVSVVRNATNGGKLFVDGQVVLNFNPVPRNGNLSNTASLRVGGATINISNAPFNGMIDETAMYGRALSDDEIRSVYLAGSLGKCKVPPFIITPPAPMRVADGSNVTFTVTAGGSPLLRYQWLRNGAPISGATNASYKFAATASAGYSARVSNLFGVVTSSVAALTLNRRPEATNAQVAATEDTPQAIVLPVFDHDGDVLTYTIVKPPAFGTLSGVENSPVPGTVRYMPNTNFNGGDSFAFKANDGLQDSRVATVSITVQPVNDPPVAQSMTLTLAEDSPASFRLVGADVEGDALSFNVGPPAQGTLRGTPPDLIYQPPANFHGSDEFSFTVADQSDVSAPAVVSIIVLPVNDPPMPVVRVFTRFLLSSNDAELRIIATHETLAHVVFDASQTRDVEDDPLTFAWWERNATHAFATGAVATDCRSVGEQHLQLRVSDGAATVTNEFVIQVITGGEAVGLLEDEVAASEMPQGKRRAIRALLQGAAKAFDAAHESSGVHHLQTVQDRIHKWVAPLDEALATQWLWISQQIVDAFTASETLGASVCKLEADEHGHRKIRFAGAKGRSYVVEASSDLLRWEIIGTAREGDPGTFEFIDPESGKHPSRFYRIKAP